MVGSFRSLSVHSSAADGQSLRTADEGSMHRTNSSQSNASTSRSSVRTAPSTIRDPQFETTRPDSSRRSLSPASSRRSPNLTLGRESASSHHWLADVTKPPSVARSSPPRSYDRHSSFDIESVPSRRPSQKGHIVYRVGGPSDSYGDDTPNASEKYLNEKPSSDTLGTADSAQLVGGPAAKRKRRRWWIVGGALGIAIVIGAVVGGVVGSLSHGSSTSTASVNTDAITSSMSAPSSVTSGTIVSQMTVGRYNTLVIFGASYCDNAHVRAAQYADSLTQSPYWQGRWSNGPVWTEYLTALAGPNAQTNATLLDYAYAGAMIQNNITSADVPDTLTQIQTFISDVTGGNSTVANAASGKTLYAIWVGINPVMATWVNALVAGMSATVQANARIQVGLNINALGNQLQLLRANQPDADLLVLPVPPLQYLPSAMRHSTSSVALQFLSSLSIAYNAGVANLLSTLGSRTLFYNATDLWVNYTTTPNMFQLTDVRDACLDVGCKQPASYLFWDEIHPPSHIHADVARRVAEFLGNATSS